MAISFFMEMKQERDSKRTEARPWLQCYITQTPPTFEECKEHFEPKGILITKTDYEDICTEMCVKPRYRGK